MKSRSSIERAENVSAITRSAPASDTVVRDLADRANPRRARSDRLLPLRRCRPLLGTFVEITVTGTEINKLNRAADSAFTAIERIQKLLSAHDPASELSRLNREAASRAVTVSGATYQLLQRADRLATDSGGAFDYTVAPTLARWGLLPEHLARAEPGNWRDVVLLRGRRIRFLRPVAIDLGGIAKGFAVDQAIEALRNCGVTSAIVNAGGDLRTIGSPAEIHLRHPLEPQSFAGTVSICDSALATSSPCFTEQVWNGKRVSHIVNPSTGTAITGAVSVTVRAPECWMADALTKVVLNAPDRAEKLLARYDAEAFVLSMRERPRNPHGSAKQSRSGERPGTRVRREAHRTAAEAAALPQRAALPDHSTDTVSVGIASDFPE